MTTLANFPLISQQTKISADGSSPNAEMDCVPTSILAGLMYLHGVTQLDKTWDPDRLLDMAYPEGYTGGTSASAFVQACATLGCTLSPFTGTTVALVAHIHEQIQAGHPVIVTVPDIYVPASYGWTHVLCAYGEEPGYITMLDPWPGRPTTKSDAEWEHTLLDNLIWILQKNAIPVEESMTIDLDNVEVARYFELASPDGSQWRSRIDVTGQGKYPILKDGMLAFYRQFGGNALCGLTYLGLPLSYEIPLPGGAPGATMQYFERGTLAYEPSVPHKVDTPPGSGAVYLMHLYNGPAQDPRLVPLQQQTGTLQAQVKQLQTQLASTQQDVQNALAATDPALQQELASAQARIASALAALQ